MGMRTEKLDLCKICGKMFLKTRDTNVCPICAPQKYSAEFTRQSESPRVLLTKNEESIKENANEQKDGKWSLKYDCCVKCGTNDVKHIARGLCLNCYQRETEKRSRGRKGQKQGIASQIMTFIFLFENYIERKRSLIDIAKECGCGRQNVLRKIRQFNIPLRTKKEARKLAYDRHKISYTITDGDGIEKLVTQGSINLNEHFFVTWSQKMAYVLGALYTDGNLFHDTKRGTYRIVMSQKEPELLNKVLKLMDCDARLRHRKKKGITGEVYFFDIAQKKVYSDLINLGLSPNKSKTIEFPDMPQDFVRHFIRGCWDGDGSVFFEQKRLVASYTSGSKNFIETLVEELYKIGISRSGVSCKIGKDGSRFLSPITKEMLSNHPDSRFPLTVHEDKRSNAYYIKIQTRENIEKLFHYFYDGVDEPMYLSRKYDVFVKGLKLEEKEKNEHLLPGA
jgi:intein-encoded DNA endonuclease-like protein